MSLYACGPPSWLPGILKRASQTPAWLLEAGESRSGRFLCQTCIHQTPDFRMVMVQKHSSAKDLQVLTHFADALSEPDATQSSPQLEQKVIHFRSCRYSDFFADGWSCRIAVSRSGWSSLFSYSRARVSGGASVDISEGAQEDCCAIEAAPKTEMVIIRVCNKGIHATCPVAESLDIIMLGLATENLVQPAGDTQDGDFILNYTACTERCLRGVCPKPARAWRRGQPCAACLQC